MTALHPFGHTITAATLLARFEPLRSWEERYRQLILLARELPPLEETLRRQQAELSGCENRVWLEGEQLPDGTLHFYGDSEGRIVKGLLAVLLTGAEGKRPEEILAGDPMTLFRQLNILDQLSASRASGLDALAQGIRHIAARYA